MLHRLVEFDEVVRRGYEDYEFRKVVSALSHFMSSDLSAFYFDVRKDALYCDTKSSSKRRAALSVIEVLFDCLVRWLAPMLPFTMEEAFLERRPSSVHLEQFPEVPREWRGHELARRWAVVRRVRQAVNGAIAVKRTERHVGSTLKNAPRVFLAPDVLAKLSGIDMGEICTTSEMTLSCETAPEKRYTADRVSVVVEMAPGRICRRSWKIDPHVGSDPEFPDLTVRDAAAMRE
ncbi:class I tRNA ligase family protein [Microvirga brassicacearum]|uniref:Class I tRNA ligase family protein n=1 Tax=Microvirga brassicacearum TaxID=2580413 RepID=A0A5N3P4I0_9HYPH|nr:class I tRNA ligase family protein [Microvirga brassicacearum]KAB0264636.1 class I tRNA ligase family protein [Microvirga brassicacearum]